MSVSTQRRTLRHWLAAGFTAAALATGAVTAPPAAAATAPATAAPVTQGVTAQISRGDIIARAQSWVDAGGYAYNQSGFTPDGWRTDCSGYVSMAWNVAKNVNGGTNTVGLLDYSTAITKGELQAGDILIDAAGTNLTRHVVLFHKWANDNRTAYWGYEQSASGNVGTKYRVISYPYDSTPDEYAPRRPNNAS
jgi:hypothetical protein